MFFFHVENNHKSEEGNLWPNEKKSHNADKTACFLHSYRENSHQFHET